MMICLSGQSVLSLCLCAHLVWCGVQVWSGGTLEDVVKVVAAVWCCHPKQNAFKGSVPAVAGTLYSAMLLEEHHLVVNQFCTVP
jgi:hypothetical protein